MCRVVDGDATVKPVCFSSIGHDEKSAALRLVGAYQRASIACTVERQHKGGSRYLSAARIVRKAGVIEAAVVHQHR